MISMVRFAASLFLTSIIGVSSAYAEDFFSTYQGKADLFTNDFFGDGHDRWRTGSFMRSFTFGPDDGSRSTEIRLRSEIISPWTDGRQGSNNDRMFVGALGVGAFWHRSFGSVDLKYGVETLVTGKQTGLDKIQEFAHAAIGYQGYNPNKQGGEQLCNCFFGLAEIEAALPIDVSPRMQVRPFASAQAGYETLARVGVDVVWGPMAGITNWVRDPVTGFLVMPETKVNRRTRNRGLSYVAGIDYSNVGSTDLIPSTGDVVASSGRLRARAGLQYGGVFIGMAHLSKEFESQTESQRVGVISLDLLF